MSENRKQHNEPHLPSQIGCGKITLDYVIDSSGTVEFRLCPTERLTDRVEPRTYLDGHPIDKLPKRWRPLPARDRHSLVQLSIRGESNPGAFSGGTSMLEGESTQKLIYDSQTVARDSSGVRVVTSLSHPSGLLLRHNVTWIEGTAYVTVSTEVINNGSNEITLDMISTCCLGGITPFAGQDAPRNLFLHRFRSRWTQEGSHEVRSLEELALERSWTGYGVRSERFGQVGSMPVRGFFPWAALEDRKAGVFWGVQLEAPASWQIEIYRTQDNVTISGGRADREFGHWWKRMAPGESLLSRRAVVSTVSGDVDDLCDALLEAQVRPSVQSDPEKRLSAIFNEWSSSWGNPTEADALEVADKLADTRCQYYVIDDGWAERPVDSFQSNGDWNVNLQAFPSGLKATCDAIRARGLIPGIWFEFEVCTEGTQAFEMTDHLLTRDGSTLQIGSRRFWDFRDPWTTEYLRAKVIERIRESGIGYLKIDYNETLGIGCDEAYSDGVSSPGEGLYRHIDAVQEFIALIRREIPDIVIENCSAGGHRLELSFLALTDVSCFSDAHECQEIPIIAANLHRLVLPSLTQVWAVVHPSDSLQRLQYSLSSLFLGRPCLSGEIRELDERQFREVANVLDFHARVAPIIIDGASRRVHKLASGLTHPEGWQAVVRHSRDGDELLVVLHTFELRESHPRVVEIQLPQVPWGIVGRYGYESAEIIQGDNLRISGLISFTGRVLHLRRMP